MNYSALNPQQQSEVDTLFADAVFGSAPGAFDYECDGEGHISGRKPSTLVKSMRRCGSGLSVIGMCVEQPAADESARAEAVIKSLAGVIVQNNFSEVRHENVSA